MAFRVTQSVSSLYGCFWRFAREPILSQRRVTRLGVPTGECPPQIRAGGRDVFGANSGDGILHRTICLGTVGVSRETECVQGGVRSGTRAESIRRIRESGHPRHPIPDSRANE